MEKELPWPPKRPPRNTDVKKAWKALHRETIAHVKRVIPADDRKTRTLLNLIKPREMNMRIVTKEEHANAAFTAIADQEMDFRPQFDQPSDDPDVPSYDQDIDGDDQDQGDLATVNVEFYSADTRFCVALSLEWKETKAPTDPDSVEITEYEYRRISLHPDTAAYLISRLSDNHRKTIADALVFQLIMDDGEQLAEEELDDGGIVPTWRNRENDPVMDILRYCTHLETLYMRIVHGQHVDDHMNDDPDAPEEM